MRSGDLPVALPDALDDFLNEPGLQHVTCIRSPERRGSEQIRHADPCAVSVKRHVIQKKPLCQILDK